MERSLRRICALSWMFFAGCSSSAGGDLAGDASTVEPDASTVVTTNAFDRVATARHLDAIATLAARGEPWLGGALAAKGNALVRDADRFVSRGPDGKRARVGDIDVALQTDFSRGLKVGLGETTRFHTQLRPIGASPASAEDDGGRVLFREAFPSTDAVVVSGARFVEIALHLRDAGAPASFSFALDLPKSIVGTHLSDEGELLLDDAKHEPVLRVRAPFAVDAHGTKVPGTLAYRDGMLTVAFSPRGLAYPIVLDPTLDVPAMTRVTALEPTQPYDSRLIYFNGSVLKTGGRSTASDMSSAVFQYYPNRAYVNSTFKYWVYQSDLSIGVVEDHAASASADGTSFTVADGYNGSTNLNVAGTFDSTTGWSGPTTITNAGSTAQVARSGSMMASQALHNGSGLPATLYEYFLIDGDGAATYDEIWYGAGGASWNRYTYGSSEVHPAKRHDGAFLPAIPSSGAGLLLIAGMDAYTSATPFADTWVLRPSATNSVLSFTWTPLCGTGTTASCGFPGRKMLFAARDSIRGRVVMGTGRNNATGANYGDIWEFDEPTQTWIAMCGTASTPTCDVNFVARYGASAAFDPNRGRTVIAGGYNDASLKYLTETWEYHVRGNSCTSASQCDSGYCVDGVCCETALCGTCQACNLASSPGVCANVAVNVDDPDSCSSGVSSCDGAGHCKSKTGQLCTDATGATCVSGNCVNGVCCQSSSCAAGQICQLTTGVCIGALGYACSSAAQCNSGYCVDGVCCDSPCDPTKPCQACGASGHCAAIAGAQPATRAASAGACPTKSGGDASCNVAVCNGSDISACHYPGSSTTCSGTSICSSGVEYDAAGCNGQGDCGYTTAKSCGVFNCVGSACKSTCSVSTDCAAGFFCSAGSCVALEGAGAACSATSQCKSGLSCVDGVCCTASSCSPTGTCNGSHPGTCTLNNGQASTSGSACTSGMIADGVCCNAACTGLCEACNVTGSVGTCVPRPSGQPPAAGHGTCISVSSDPICGASTCNGTSRTTCSATAAGTTCGAYACASGKATTTGSCDGLGSCTGQQSIVCAPYTCGATSCKTTCTQATETTDCQSGYYCDATNHCTTKLAIGTTCASSDQCSSGNCVDHVCCSSASCPSGGVCNDPSFLGTCSIQLGKACVAGTPCASGFCADGVCCNAACTGQCEACAVTGLVGTCSPVPNKQQPYGARTPCPSSGTDPTCGQSYCDGVQRKACVYPDSNTSCGSASCTAGKYVSGGVCSGGGACLPTSSGGCAPYVCGTSTCLTDCTAHGDADCAAGAYCDSTAHCAYRTAAGTPCASTTACGTGLYCVDNICCGSSSCPNGTCVNSGTEKGVCKFANGQTCSLDDDCVSAHCVDGVCCNETCTDQCAACNNAGSVGVCTPTLGAPVGGRAPCPGDGTTCGSETCTGTSRSCAYPSSATPCGAVACDTSLNQENDPGYCDATAHTCQSTVRQCGYFRCKTTSCLTGCTSDADCVDNAYCATDGSCQLKGVLGQTCDPSVATACGADASGKTLGCQDGVCCDDPQCDAHGGFCGGTHPGTCLARNDSTCTTDAQCSSGHCVEKDASGNGVCCDTACDGVCESCRTTQGPGTCMPIAGAPVPGHGACPAGTGDACSTPVCDGKDGKSCKGHPGAETICAPASCSAGKYTGDMRCDGSGACPSSTKTDCDNHRVCADANHCAIGRCATDSDCVDGYACEADSGNCKPKGAHCKDTDPTVSIGVDGVEHPCAPYLCNSDGNCKTACATSSDCAGGNSCDTTSSTCVAADAASANTTANGGCAIDARDGNASKSWAFGALGLAVAALARARRRRKAA